MEEVAVRGVSEMCSHTGALPRRAADGRLRTTTLDGFVLHDVRVVGGWINGSSEGA
jgi:hypothetical protein